MHINNVSPVVEWLVSVERRLWDFSQVGRYLSACIGTLREVFTFLFLYVPELGERLKSFQILLRIIYFLALSPKSYPVVGG